MPTEQRQGAISSMLKRPVLIAAVLVTVVVLAGLGGAYAYFFSGLRTTPKPLTLSSKATSTPAASATTSGSSGATLAGNWTVSSGSLAGYRVQEQFAGQSASHEAVARTSSVSGGLSVQQSSSGLQASSIKFTVQLANLKSVDQVAGFDVSRRDSIVSQTLSVSQYPDATFQAQSVALPASAASGGTESLTIPGQLTIHGVTKSVQVTVQLKVSGSQAQAVGSATFQMTDFGVSPPQIPITTVQPKVTLEFQLALVKA
jgi:polyisoprenoid-binding protein YceI